MKKLLALLFLLAVPAGAADFCTNPTAPYRLTLGSYSNPAFAMPGATFDDWLERVEQLCTSYTHGTLPTCNAGAEGITYSITDATTAGGCDSGGSATGFCQCTGAAYQAVGSGAGFSGSYTGDVVFDGDEANSLLINNTHATDGNPKNIIVGQREGVNRFAVTSQGDEVGSFSLYDDDDETRIQARSIAGQSDIQFGDGGDLFGAFGCWSDGTGCFFGSEDAGAATQLYANANNITFSDDWLSTVSCIGVDSNRLFGNTDCDVPPVKDVGEFDLDNTFTDAVQSVTCTDNANGGTPQALTINPTASTVAVTNADAQGCTVTMSESGALEGNRTDIIIVSNAGGTVDFSDTSGVSELSGAFNAGIYDVLSLKYLSARWIETSSVDN